MATVVVTLLIITRFYVSKMDADSDERQRDRISRREKRWSMNSQRLEQIVAELMRPIGDLRHSFDTDLSALLEKYLTEAGLHALEAEGEFSPERGAPGGCSPERGAGGGHLYGAPNFAELALLLQQSANIYGRKVDFLYQHVLAVSESLHLSTSELSQEPGSPSPTLSEGASPGALRRRRRPSAGGWARLSLQPCASARRDPPPQAPPTLPRLFAELEPRVLGPADVPLLDYSGEPVGLLQDFHVAWRLDDGLLVEELDRGMGEAASSGLRAISLAELQAAIAAAAPTAALACSTPLPPEDPPPDTAPEPSDEASVDTTEAPGSEAALQDSDTETLAEAAADFGARRKRRHGPDDLCDHTHKLYITPELRLFLRQEREFKVPAQWRARVVAARRGRLLRARASLEPLPTEFYGFVADKADIGGFLGFEADASAAAEVSVALSRLADAAQDSDDDGFFELSSLSSEGERRLPSPPPPRGPAAGAGPAEWEAWRAGVVARAAAGEVRGLDVRALGAAVLDALPGPEGGSEETPFANVLDTAATDDSDVSRLFLATLFLANSGNVEVVAGAPLALNSFSLRLVSRDERRYCAAAAADPAFLAR